MKKFIGFSLLLFLFFCSGFSSEILGFVNDITENEDIKIQLSSGILYQPYKGKLMVTTLKLKIENLSKSAMKIIWDETILTDNSRFESGVIHEGIKYMNKSESQVPTIILPSKTLDDTIIPKSHISYKDNSSFEGWFIEPYDYLVRNRTLYLTYEVNGERKSIMLDFEIYDKGTYETEEKKGDIPTEPLDLQETFNDEVVVSIRTEEDKIIVSFKNISSKTVDIPWNLHYFKVIGDIAFPEFEDRRDELSPNELCENIALYSNKFTHFQFDYWIGYKHREGNMKLSQDKKEIQQEDFVEPAAVSNSAVVEKENNNETEQNKKQISEKKETVESSLSKSEVCIDHQKKFNDEITVSAKTKEDKIIIEFKNVSSKPVILDWNDIYFKDKWNKIVFSFPKKTSVILPSDFEDNSVTYDERFCELSFKYKIGLAIKSDFLELPQTQETAINELNINLETNNENTWFEDNQTLLITVGAGVAVISALALISIIGANQ